MLRGSEIPSPEARDYVDDLIILIPSIDLGLKRRSDQVLLRCKLLKSQLRQQLEMAIHNLLYLLCLEPKKNKLKLFFKNLFVIEK